ncbi:MAG: SPASM domain-containing protein, partial [Candidatus Riflebacteria bacterium]|nr:SPASM domain-containing protein [Candidatus Riflebacteria bacterium]
WLNWIFEQQFLHHFPVEVVCSPQYERVCRERAAEVPAELDPTRPGQEHLAGRFGCLAATQFCLIANAGVVYPCLYLLEPAGSILEESFASIWQSSPVFEALRDTRRLGGKCGICKYADLCGGCRALAKAAAGDMKAADPFCSYQPG